MDIKICIIYKEGDRACSTFLDTYNRFVLPKVRKYRLVIPVISTLNLKPAQSRLFGKYINRGIFPFAYVGKGKTSNEVYTNMDQVIDIIIAVIKATKTTYDRGTYVKQIGIKPVEDFLELERQKGAFVEAADVPGERIDDSFMTGDSNLQSKIISQAIPYRQKNQAMMGQYASGAAEDFGKKGGFDPIERSFVKDQIDAEQHDIDMFVFETFKDTAYDPDYAGAESKISADGVGDRLPSRLAEIMRDAR